jgi:hypothetical protein
MNEVKSGEKVINQKVKGVMTIIGNILTNIIIGNALIWLYLPEKTDYYFDDKIETKKLIVSLILTFSNITKLFFSFYTKYNNIRIYILLSFLLLILSHSLLYMFTIKVVACVSFILYGIGVGFPFHQLRINSSIHFIEHKSLILFINKFSYNISPILYYFFFSYIKTISPNGSEIIIFYLFVGLITTLISFDYLKECRTDKNEPSEKSLLIKNELEYSITDITNNTDRNSIRSENSINLSKGERSYLPGENENITGVFISKRQSIISVLKDKNIYFILIFFTLAMFLTVEKIHKITIDNTHLFLSVLFISKVIFFLIFSTFQIPSIILRLAPFFIHALIITVHSFHSKTHEYSTKIEIILVSVSYSVNYTVIHPLLKKIYGEKNAIFFTDFVINVASASRWILLFFDSIRNTVRILVLVFMIISLLFISPKTFEFNTNSKDKKLGIELQDKNNIEDIEEINTNEEKENEIEDALAIVDVKSDIEEI